MVILGNIAIRNIGPLQWDGENMKFTNDIDADKYLQRQYRSGWSL
jgi:hypothetical protein